MVQKKQKRRQNVRVGLYICVLVGLLMACDLVHAVLSSVAAEKQHYYLMKLLPIKTILCTCHYYYSGLVTLLLIT